jgi:hypothetical protein
MFLASFVFMRRNFFVFYAMNPSPGPDGFPAEFYQVFWDTIKEDMMAMFF